MTTYKNPLEQSEDFTSPFNKWKVSTESESMSPSAFFKDESKRLVNMSPNDYFKFVSHQIGTTPEKLMEQRSRVANQLSVDDIQKKMHEGVKFDTPWLRVLDRGEKGTVVPYWQEGLHRMLAAGREYGMDRKFPIYLGFENDPWNELDSMTMNDFINYYDSKRQERQEAYKKQQEEEDQQREDLNLEFAADYFGVSKDQVTPEMLKQYKKYEDDLFKEIWTDDAFEEVLRDIRKK